MLSDPRSRLILIVPPILQFLVFGFRVHPRGQECDDRRARPRWRALEPRDHRARWRAAPMFSGSSRWIPTPRSRRHRHGRSHRRPALRAAFPPMSAPGAARGRRTAFDGRRSTPPRSSPAISTEWSPAFQRRHRRPALPTLPATSVPAVTYWFNPNLDYTWFTIPGLMAIISRSRPFGGRAIGGARKGTGHV